MAHFSTSIFSRCFGGQTHVNIILPICEEFEEYVAEGEKFQTLWLLHGGGGNSHEWANLTDIERLALNHKLAVVMPEIGTNFYTDLPHGGKYFTYITQELPSLLRKYFPLSDKREDNFIVGLSMGGFGAAKCAFNCPEKFGAAGLMSTGPINPIQLERVKVIQTGKENSARGEGWYEMLFGGKDAIKHSENDVWWVLKKQVEAGKQMPLIYDCCGTEDLIYPGFIAFRQYVKASGLDQKISVTFEEGPGSHTWDFWSEYIKKFLDWLPLLKNRNFYAKFRSETGNMCGELDNSKLTQADIDWLSRDFC